MRNRVPESQIQPRSPALVLPGDFALRDEDEGVLQSVYFAASGKNLVESQFGHGLTDEELLQFVVKGRDTSELLTTTGVAMPPRGENPLLTDNQLRAVIAVHTSSNSTSVVQAAPNTVSAVPTTAPLVATVIPTSFPVTPQPFTTPMIYPRSGAGCHGANDTGRGSFGLGWETSRSLTDRAA